MANHGGSTATRAVAIYFLLTLFISWGALLLFMGPGGMMGVAEVPAERMPLLYVGMVAGPTLAGLLMTGLTDGRGGFTALLTRLRRWRVGIVWYAIAILTAPGLTTLTLLLLSRFSPGYVPLILTTPDKATLLLSGVLAGILVGIFEELGWTGFAIPRLGPRRGIVATGLVVGLVWGLWHAPLFTASARASQGVPPLLALVILLFTFLPAYRVLMVWVYDRTRSVLVAMLMHAALTATTLILGLSATDVKMAIFNLVFTALLWMVAAVATRTGHSKHPRGAESAGPA